MHKDNRLAVGVFCALATQWRVVSGMTGMRFLGLDYTAAEAAARMLRVPRRELRQLFYDLQTMEAAALPIRNGATAHG